MIPVLCLLFPAGTASAQTTLAEVDDWIDGGQFAKARTTLEQMRQARPQDPEVLWRLARVKVDVGEQTRDKNKQRALYLDAHRDAEAAVQAGPNSADTYLTRAITAGRVALLSGSREKVERSRGVKEDVDRAIALDPANASAYHVRGRWNYEVADLGFVERAVVKVVYGGLPDASFEQAARDFQQALQVEDKVIHHLELGRTYLKLGRKAEAQAEFLRVLALPDTDPDDPMHKQEARRLSGVS
jgi:tetratricopeptide (TPR) repeat protein